MKKKITTWFLFLSILSIQILNAEEKFLSLKKNKVNVRYGPSFDSEIKYIYKKINLGEIASLGLIEHIKLYEKYQSW